MPTTRTFEVHEIVQEVRLEATPARVWKALVEETSSWWHRDFYTGRNPRAFHIEARLGGAMWEDWGDGQGLDGRRHDALVPRDFLGRRR